MNKFLLAVFAVAALTISVQAKDKLQDEAIPVTGGYMNGYRWLNTRPPTVGLSNPSKDFYSFDGLSERAGLRFQKFLGDPGQSP